MDSNTTHSFGFVLGCSFVLISPTFIAFGVPKKWIVKWDKQMFACSLGTICAFLFIEVIPTTFHQIAELKSIKTQCIIFSCVILLGMTISALLELLDVDDHNHNLNKTNQSITNQTINKQIASFCSIPSTAKAIMFATIIHNVIDGIMIGFHPTTAVPLFFHELTHALGQLAIYVNLGIGKEKAIFLRFCTDLFVPIAAVTAYNFGITRNHNLMIHVYGHCLLTGLFLYIMLVDLLPLILGTNEGTDQNANIDSNNEEANTTEQGSKQMVYCLFCFVIAFSIVSGIILVNGHSPEQTTGVM